MSRRRLKPARYTNVETALRGRLFGQLLQSPFEEPPFWLLTHKCQSPLWLRTGKRGFFLACSGFPKCRNIKPVSKDEGEKLRVEAEALREQMKAERAAAQAAQAAQPPKPS